MAGVSKSPEIQYNFQLNDTEFRAKVTEYIALWGDSVFRLENKKRFRELFNIDLQIWVSLSRKKKRTTFKEK